MTAPMLAMFNGWEIVLILVLALVLFGAKKLPELAKGLGHGIKEFKKATRDVQEEIHQAMDVDSPPAPPPPRRLPEPPASPTAESEPEPASTEEKR